MEKQHSQFSKTSVMGDFAERQKRGHLIKTRHPSWFKFLYSMKNVQQGMKCREMRAQYPAYPFLNSQKTHRIMPLVKF